MQQDAIEMDDGGRQESETQRADRRFNDLLQELRVAQTGVQFLFAFLLTLAFTQRFGSISEIQKWIYVGTLLSTVAASALLIGPVALHRHFFRRRLKPRLVTQTDRMARGGLAMLVVSINGAVLLILDVVIGGPLAILLTLAATFWFVGLWYVLPWIDARDHDRHNS